MASPAEGLRKILALEQEKKCSDSVVVGGLDSYLLRYLQDNNLSTSHPLSRVVQSLPPGGYRALHKIQRQRVIEELLKVAENGASTPAAAAQPARPPAAPAKAAPTPKQAPSTAIRVSGTLNSPLSALGVRKPDEARFRRLRVPVHTVHDLLYHFPRDYHDYSEARKISELVFGEEQTVIGTVWTSGQKTMGRQKRKATEVVINDSTGSLRVLWWNQPWIAQRFRPGMKVALSGKVTEFGGRLQMDGPEIDPVDEELLASRRRIPIYPATEGLTQLTIREAVKRALDAFADALPDAIPPEMQTRMGFSDISEAIRQVHFPDSIEAEQAAVSRFAFEELLYIEVGVVRRRQEWQAGGGAPRLVLPEGALEGYVAALPFDLTGAQRRAIGEVLADIAKDVPMSRLVEGDVGSGKTVVAAASLLAAVASGYQGAIMAPTEILAEQHFRTFTSTFDSRADVKHQDGPWFEHRAPGYVVLHPEYMSRPVSVALLTGSLKQSEKTAAAEAIARGEVDIVVGTHALVQGSVSFARLGLAVIDEQHRFGVDQRMALREKGDSPHVLVMTATPIPRTLALTVYGDLDLTVLDEMPPGRLAVKTFRVLPYRRDEAFDLARKRIAEGRQAYVICPLVEESSAIEARAATQEFERLSRDVFPDLRLGLLHGRMTPKEKDSVMVAFRDHEIDILVSTAVVEVGVDVPNATVILIEGAERFGLSQLHQFRGRVRRSKEQAWCFLLTDNPSPESQERLAAMETMDNGFDLAQRDLELRGAGEYFGTRQSGVPDLRIATLSNVRMIEAARKEATKLLEDDPGLEEPQHRMIAERVRELWDSVTAEVS